MNNLGSPTLLLLLLLMAISHHAVDGLVLSDRVRDVLATKLNDIVDLPLVGEAAEQRIAENLIDICMDPFEETINETSPDEMLDVLKDLLVTKMNARVDIPFTNEEQEAKVLGLIVSFFLRDRFADIAQKIAESTEEECAAAE